VTAVVAASCDAATVVHCDRAGHRTFLRRPPGAGCRDGSAGAPAVDHRSRRRRGAARWARRSARRSASAGAPSGTCDPRPSPSAALQQPVDLPPRTDHAQTPPAGRRDEGGARFGRLGPSGVCGRPAGSGRLAPLAQELVGTPAPEHGQHRLQHDGDVESERPVLDVEQVESHRLLPREIGPTRYLPEARDSWFHHQPTPHQ
jgi:hypothetical protein